MPRVGSSRISTSGLANSHLLQHHLLLVAARQVAGLLVDARGADVGPAAIVVGDVEFAQIVDHAAARHAVEIGERDVVLDVVDEVEAVGLAVLGDVGDAVLDGPADRSRRRSSCR